MPDVNGIIADYKEASRQKELERQAELNKKGLQRILNAEAVEDCIKRIIEPVFENAKDQVVHNGFPCEVEFTSKKDPFFSEPKTVAVGIKIITQSKANPSPRDNCHLQYQGRFEAQEITKSEWIANTASPSQESSPIPIVLVDGEMIDKDLELFLRKVFKA